MEWQRVSTSQERRLARQERKRCGPRADAGARRPEWRCAECYTTNWMAKDKCRRCNHAVTGKDVYLDEYGQHAAWPERWSWHSPQQNVPPVAQQQQKQQSQQLTPLQQARAQCKCAKEQGFPAACLEFLQRDLERLESEERQHRPIGQRLDAARSAFTKAVDKCERMDTQLKNAKIAMDKAKMEVIETHTEVGKLMSEAATKKEDGQAAPKSPTSASTSKLAAVLADLTTAVEEQIPAEGATGPASESLMRSLQASKEALQEVSSDSEAECVELVVLD